MRIDSLGWYLVRRHATKNCCEVAEVLVDGNGGGAQRDSGIGDELGKEGGLPGIRDREHLRKAGSNGAGGQVFRIAGHVGGHPFHIPFEIGQALSLQADIGSDVLKTFDVPARQIG